MGPSSTPDWPGSTFPSGHGGLDYPVQLQAVVRRLLDEAGAPNGQMMNITGYGQGAATIVRERQRGAAAPIPAAALHLRGDLVPALQ